MSGAASLVLPVESPMVDKPRRPILHLKFPAPAATSDTPKEAPDTPRSLAATTRVFTPPPKPAGRPFGAGKPFGASKPFGAPKKAPAAPKPAPPEWRCKPCGKGFEVASSLADDEAVRCPACNARLGLAADFRSDPPNLAKVRARAVGKSL